MLVFITNQTGFFDFFNTYQPGLFDFFTHFNWNLILVVNLLMGASAAGVSKEMGTPAKAVFTGIAIL